MVKLLHWDNKTQAQVAPLHVLNAEYNQIKGYGSQSLVFSENQIFIQFKILLNLVFCYHFQVFSPTNKVVEVTPDKK